MKWKPVAICATCGWSFELMHLKNSSVDLPSSGLGTSGE